MKKRILLLLATAVMMTGCGLKSGSTAKSEAMSPDDPMNKPANLYESLSDEQKKYLEETFEYNEEAINECSYESLNKKLLGTGLELYNQSSGVEVFGLEYKLDESVDKSLYGSYYINQECKSDKLITYDEALDIREKEKNMRLEDFLGYKYTVKSRRGGDSDFGSDEGEANTEVVSDAADYNGNDANHYTMKVEMSDYKGKEMDGTLYVNIYFSEFKDGTVKIKLAPVIYYEASEKDREDGISDQVFSFYYDSILREPFFDDPYGYFNDESVYCEIQYSSVTSKSLVVEVANNTDKDVTGNYSFELYKVENGDKKIVKECESDVERTQHAGAVSIYPVDLAFDGEELEPGDYYIEFGEDKSGYVYGEMSFEVQEG